MIPRTMIMGESSVQLPSQYPVDEIKKMVTFESLKVHTELGPWSLCSTGDPAKSHMSRPVLYHLATPSPVTLLL